jgi:ABC-type nitrate/sulfonate/bicarbonate transport system permease component
LIIIFVWWALAIVTDVLRGVSFPTPIDVFGRLVDSLLGADLQGSSIYDQMFASLTRWGWGYLLATVIGLAAGCILGMYGPIYDLSIVSVYVLQLIPGLAWIPIAMLLFGLGEVATIFMIFMAALPPIIINTAGGIRSIPPIYEKATGMMGTSFLTKFTHVLMPASAISVINGLRIGLANSWRVLIAAEMVVGVALGLGYSIIQSRYDLDYEGAFVSIMVICVIGIVVEKLLFQVLEDSIRERLGMEKRE